MVWLSIAVFSLLVSSPNYEGPQVPAGKPETLYDQGLVRNGDGRVIDYWRVIDGHIVRIKKLKIGDKTFDVIVLQQREGNLRPYGDRVPTAFSTYAAWVPNLHSWVREFWDEEYQDRLNPEVYQLAKSERDIFNGVSTLIIITKENDLSNIQSIFRVVRKGELAENQKLDIEANFGDLPPVEKKFAEINGIKVVLGDWAELKSLTVRHGTGIDFLPYLVRGLDEFDLYAFGKRKIKIDGVEYPWGATHLAVEADPARRRYYMRDFNFAEEKRRGKLSLLTQTVGNFLKQLEAEKNNPRFFSAEVNAFYHEPPIAAWNYIPIPSVETKRRATLIDSPLLEATKKEIFFGSPQVPFFRSALYPMPQIDLDLQRRAAPDHPFDPLKRMGILAEEVVGKRDQTIHYNENNRAETLRKSIGLFRDHARRYFNPDIAPAYIEAPRNPTHLLIEPKTVIEQHRKQVQAGFADTRFDYEAPTDSPLVLATRILTNPWGYYSDLDWAVEFAIENRHEHPELNKALAKTLIQLLPNPIIGSSMIFPDRENYEKEITHQSELIDKIFASLRKEPFKDNATRRLLLDPNIVRPSSTIRIAKLLMEWGIQNSDEVAYLLSKAFFDPELTSRIIDIAHGDPEIGGILKTLSMEQIMEVVNIKAVLTATHEIPHFGGPWGRQTQMAQFVPEVQEVLKLTVDRDDKGFPSMLMHFGGHITAYREESLIAPADMEKFLLTLKQKWPPLFLAFVKTYYPEVEHRVGKARLNEITEGKIQCSRVIESVEEQIRSFRKLNGDRFKALIDAHQNSAAKPR